jgi:cobalamin biosynthesis Mg chelatase CobN
MSDIFFSLHVQPWQSKTYAKRAEECRWLAKISPLEFSYLTLRRYLETLRRAYDQARRAVAQDLSRDTALNEVRNDVILALNELIGSLQARTLAQDKIEKAKALVDSWIKLLKEQS